MKKIKSKEYSSARIFFESLADEDKKKLIRLHEDNLPHIKARDILKTAIHASIGHPLMTSEVKETGELFIILLEEAGIPFKYDADSVIDPIKKIVVKETQSDFGRSGANAKHERTNDLKSEIRKIWASGKYTSREICADEEWVSLGFTSRKTARGALTNTPDPSPWPAKEIKIR